MNKIIVLPVSVLIFCAACIAQAGVLDALNPAVMGARAAAADLQEKSVKLNQPYGLFGAYWSMLERDFVKKFKQCAKGQGEEVTYKEYRIIQNTKVAVTYRFKKNNKSKTAGLVQIVLVPVIEYKTTEDITTAYTLFRDYITNNVTKLSEIEYIEDKNGNITQFTSFADFKYSKLVHMVVLQKGRVIHMINFFKKKQS